MQNMGQYLLLFIIFALIAVFLSLMTLFACVFGRTTSTTTLVSSLDGTSTWVTDTTITAFFDSAMGWRYNLESVSMICSVVVSLYATILSFVSHTQSSDEGPDAEAGWLIKHFEVWSDQSCFCCCRHVHDMARFRSDVENGGSTSETPIWPEAELLWMLGGTHPQKQ